MERSVCGMILVDEVPESGIVEEVIVGHSVVGVFFMSLKIIIQLKLEVGAVGLRGVNLRDFPRVLCGPPVSFPVIRPDLKASSHERLQPIHIMRAVGIDVVL